MLVSFGGALIVMLQNDPTMAAIALCGAPISLFVSRYNIRKMREYEKRNQEFASKNVSFNQEIFQHMQTIKAFGLVETFIQRYENRQKEAVRLQLDRNKFQQRGSIATSLVGQAIGYACYGFAIYRLWRGDITRLAADAVVNAANSALLGCFIPCHGCIDNAIHSAAGLQLRDACFQLMRAQGHEEPAGSAKITPGYNLPARFVLHTVGPIVNGPLEARHRAQLASCYRACLALAAERGLESVAFCCISTGEFHFPAPEAAQLAVGAVQEFLREKTSIRKVIFNVFQERDADLYRALLGPDRAPEG